MYICVLQENARSQDWTLWTQHPFLKYSVTVISLRIRRALEGNCKGKPNVIYDHSQLLYFLEHGFGNIQHKLCSSAPFHLCTVSPSLYSWQEGWRCCCKEPSELSRDGIWQEHLWPWAGRSLARRKLGYETYRCQKCMMQQQGFGQCHLIGPRILGVDSRESQREKGRCEKPQLMLPRQRYYYFY